jgi:phosphoribosylamine--glycine ligase
MLVVGQGAREHALVWKLKQSPVATQIYAAPGNAGIGEIATCVPIDATDIPSLADFAQDSRIDLTIVGPELPLALGIVDVFRRRGLRIFGPTQAAAELEASKVFAKTFMRRHGIPTGDVTICNFDEVETVLAKASFPVVIKIDRLAARSAVAIVHSRDAARHHLNGVFRQHRLALSHNAVLIEECLSGDEVSFVVLTDGRHATPLAPAKDYKRAYDGDRGPNTGGMGAHSPTHLLTQSVIDDIMQRIVAPTIAGMAAEGRPYSGALFAGIMLTHNGPRVLEFNCRLGDPETQVQMLRLRTDLADVLDRVESGRMMGLELQWQEGAAVSIVIACEEYPKPVRKGRHLTVSGVDSGVVLFHGATRWEGNSVVNSGGRVINVCGVGPSLVEAMAKAYSATSRVTFEGSRFRSDIGRRIAENIAPNRDDKCY